MSQKYIKQPSRNPHGLTVVDNQPSIHDRKLSQSILEHARVINQMQLRYTQIQQVIGDISDLPDNLVNLLKGLTTDVAQLGSTSIALVEHYEELLERVDKMETIIEQRLGYSPPPPTHRQQKFQTSEQALQADDTPDMSDRVSRVSGVSDSSMVDQLLQSQDFRRDVQIYTKPQLIQMYGVSDSTIVRVKRLLREQGFNI